MRHIMSTNDRFAASSNSLELNPEDSDYENEVHIADTQLVEPEAVPSRYRHHDNRFINYNVPTARGLG